RMTYYFKVNSVLTVVVPVILINEETLNNRRANEGLFYGIYFGVLLIMTFYNLVIFIRTREKAFLYYVLYISFFMLANFSLLGYSFQYFWPDNTFWAQRCTLFFFSMSTGAALQFGRKFLDLKNHQPVADLIARWSFRFIFLYGVLYIFFYTVFFSYFSSLLTLFTCIFLLYTGIFAVIKRYRPAYYYLIAWTAFLIAIIILVLMSQGIIPTNSFTRNAIYFASALEAGLLSLALADRMNILAREKGIAQERLIELMQKDKEKEDLIDIVSHDLKGPINAINGLVNIMLMDKEKFSREDIGYLDHMNKISYRLLESVKRQLDLSALKNQNIRVHLEPLNISDQLKEILKNYEIDTRGKNMQIKTKISGENLMTLANREYLQHIFENLLSNAIKFSEQGKNIYINLSEVNDHIRTIITDEGPGISEVDREKMYKKFQKLSARPTAGESSSGLGLSIVKKYTDALGGHLDCVSEKGKGTSFIIELKKYTGL
ncbi:MAG: sensor histidine kinase, partial [Cyclobacteriaceae bacterium]|nr:sensor histidine kinase [Cyclobacteriaceae bacterium]